MTKWILPTILIIGALALVAWGVKNALAMGNALARADSLAALVSDMEAKAEEAAKESQQALDSLEIVKDQNQVLLDDLDQKNREAAARARDFREAAEAAIYAAAEAGDTVEATLMAMEEVVPVGPLRDMVGDARRQLYEYRELVAGRAMNFQEQIRALSDQYRAEAEARMLEKARADTAERAVVTLMEEVEVLERRGDLLQEENLVLREATTTSFWGRLAEHGKAFGAGALAMLAVVLTAKAG